MKVFSEEYRRYVSAHSPEWLRRRRLCFAASLGRDIVCPLLPAQEADHLRYAFRSGRPIFGSELPWRDIVPLSRASHKCVTILRDVPGLKQLVNLYLRASFLAWWYALAAASYVLLSWAIGRPQASVYDPALTLLVPILRNVAPLLHLLRLA